MAIIYKNKINLNMKASNDPTFFEFLLRIDNSKAQKL